MQILGMTFKTFYKKLPEDLASLGAKRQYFMNTKTEVKKKSPIIYSHKTIYSIPFTFLNEMLSSEFNVVSQFKLFRNLHGIMFL